MHRVPHTPKNKTSQQQQRPVNRHVQLNTQHVRAQQIPIPQRAPSPWAIVSQVTSTQNAIRNPYTIANNIDQNTTVVTCSNSLLHYHTVSNTTPPIVQMPHSRAPEVTISKFSEELQEEIKEEDDLQDPGQMREKVLQYYCDSIENIKVNFRERLQELFFIQSGGNMVDYPAWKQRPNPHLLSFLNIYRLDDNTSMSTPTATNTVSPSIKMQATYASAGSVLATSSVAQSVDHSSIVATTKPQNNVTFQQYGFVQGLHRTSQEDKNKIIKQENLSSLSINRNNIPHHDDAKHSNSIQNISRPSSSSNSLHEDIAGQARHESETLQRISHLRKNGLWSASRLPKVFEQPRKKSHWDFLLEEMQWLATDFSQEKRWKRNMAKKISRSVLKYHQDKIAQEKRIKKEEVACLKRVASGIAKEVKQFWHQIDKVACYKQQARQEEQRRKALDMHLNFIVDQTEKYSSWLVEGMKDSAISSPISSKNDVSDGDFEPDSVDILDDEETIAEQEEHDSGKYEDELDQLKRESEMPIEEILESLPLDMKMKISGQKSTENEEKDADSNCSEEIDEDVSDEESDEDDYVADGSDMDDDEQTIDDEENIGGVDHKTELEDLQKENDLSIEELMKLYGRNVDNVEPEETKESSSEDEQEEEEGDTSKDFREETPLKMLTEDNDANDTDGTVPNKELNDAAATAESLQPKGFTLSTTQVKTKVPFLLRHTLREYQHIGLDWLVTMYHKQLNGILADEMGLGKTIQTIALLAHLACEEVCWGPHLIVVPTSVMLNWEYELKKWCPGFKILTYYGNQKERKLKRAGWSKPNAFHVCITSYKLVIQDHQAFRRRKWKYFILDEAQNIKNFKSQRWQMLLNFNSQRRLLLTGTPLQNNLMELWSLMHFLMPNIFQSHQDFKEWFANPLTGMIEGSREYSEGIIKRLHTVLRPFLLRRLKNEVELQMPKKYEHVIRCRLSKRQRFLYDEFMSRTKTKETLETGNFLSVINILMQLRKVCNHPDLFELRPTVSPYVMDEILYSTASLVQYAMIYDPLKEIDFRSWNFCLADFELTLGAFQAHRTNQLRVKKSLIQELSSVDNVNSTNASHPYFRNTSSQFQPLANVSDQDAAGITELEESRSYLDVITPSNTTSGYTTIGDILTRQVEDSIDNSEVDLINVVDDEPMCSLLKKPKIDSVEKPKIKGPLLEHFVADEVSPFFLGSLKEKHLQQHSNRLKYMAATNERHCDASPVYGLDLHEAVRIVNKNSFIGAMPFFSKSICCCEILQKIVKSPKTRLAERKPLTDRFSLYVQPLISYPIVMRTSHNRPTKVQEINNLVTTLTESLSEKMEFLSPLLTNSLIQFPETRLVQYDCGKLQALNPLLRELKSEKHRALIFTQMTRMLDVLERFLNYNGYIYIRLDGTTRVEQRQVLMERFNQDEKIFIFILSTRSGGIGVNLTGADTVIFYDSDWNPTMDAQAQDRCHRIGQTRDVHIYRLISDRTIEENILKKAQQKRMLGNIAIEGGNFTAAYFKQDSVKELFNMNTENQEIPLIEEKEVKETVEEEKITEPEVDSSAVAIKNIQYEQVLSKAEEDDDAKAAQRAKAEQDSELLEFNENVPLADSSTSNEVSKVEQALIMMESELRPIERFALKFVESTNSYQVEDEVDETEKKLEMKKKEWELDHLQSLKEAEEKRNAEEEDDMFFTYIRDDTYPKHFIDEYSGIMMPIWTPPTPPRDGEVEYVTDQCLAFLYEPGTIPENHLPPTHYLKKGSMDLYAMKRNTDRTHYLSVFQKKRHRLSKPKSIFDKKALELLNKSKLKKSKLKQKSMNVPVVSSISTRPDYSQHGPEWLINEDWALLQVVNTLSELPLDFQNESIHNKLANWELAADVVNSTSRIRRSARQCRDRYQNVILPREEGKLMSTPQSDMNEAKLKKNKKTMQHVHPPKPAVVAHPQAKTHPQFNQDHGKAVVNMHYSKFDSVKKASLKRKPTIKQPNTNKIQGTSRHSQILAANGISADKPLNPRELATMRAERIAKEKAQAVIAAQQLQQQTAASSTAATSQTQSTVALSNRTSLAQATNVPVAAVGQLAKASIVQASHTTGSIRGSLVFTSTGPVGASSLVVNPSGSSTTNSGLSTTAASFAAINRKMQNVTQNVVTMGQLPSGTTIGAAARVLGTQTHSAQVIPGLVSSKGDTQSGTLTFAVTSTPSSTLAPNLVAQVQRGASIAGTTGTPAGLITTQPFIQGKTLTPHQIAILRQKAAQQQQQQQLQKIQQQRLQQHKQQQLKLIQQQQQLQQTQSQGQSTKQVQPAIVASSNQLGLTVQTMKAPVTLRGSAPQQIMTQPLTAVQQQQLLALKKQQFQQLQQRGQLASNSQIQQMLAGQKLTPHQLQQLQQQQRHSQIQQQQQLKFQQQVTATIVTQPKTQLVMTQVKQGQGVSGQSLKTTSQQIQLQQTGSSQTSLPQQILLRPTTSSGQAQFQGLPQQIQLRAMISQQSNQMQRVNSGQQLQAMQAQVNLQTGTVVMQPQQVNTVSQQLSTAQVQVVSSLAQQQQRNIQAAVQKQVQQQQQSKTISSVASTTKPTQVQLHLQQPQLSQQIQRQQVLSATPAQLSQVKALVSQAQLKASLSRSNSPVGPSSVSGQSVVNTSTASTASTQASSIQLQAQQVSQQIRHQQLVQVQLKTSGSEAIAMLQQQQLKLQLQQLQAQAVKQRQTSPTQPMATVTQRVVVNQKIVESPLAKTEVSVVDTLGAETELATDGLDDKDDDPTAQGKMRTRSHKPT